MSARMTMKTGDNYEVRIGMWVEDCSGQVYEIMDVLNNEAKVRKVEFDEPKKPKAYTYGMSGTMTADELAYCSWI